MHPERMYSQLVEKVQLMLDLIEIRHPNTAVSGVDPAGVDLTHQINQKEPPKAGGCLSRVGGSPPCPRWGRFF